MLETIIIKSDTEVGYMIINLDEYDQDIHKEHDIESASKNTKNEPIEIDSDVSVKKTRSKKVTLGIDA